MHMLYFAWVRESIGKAEETLSPPPDVKTLNALIDWLENQDQGYKDAFKDRSFLRAAVNQDFVQWDAPISVGDEIAIFPPVTGG